MFENKCFGQLALRCHALVLQYFGLKDHIFGKSLKWVKCRNQRVNRGSLKRIIYLTTKYAGYKYDLDMTTPSFI